MGYTWRKDGSSFNPGKLDYVFYSDATIDTGKYFILNTLAMDDISLNNYELQWEDTQNASDHLPIVFDITINNEVGIEKEPILPNQQYYIQIIRTHLILKLPSLFTCWIQE